MTQDAVSLNNGSYDDSNRELRSETPPTQQQQQQPKRWAQDENGREYPISTDRASAISRWIKEAPLSMGGTKKKKSGARKKKAPAWGVEDAIQNMRILDAFFRSEKSRKWEKP